MGKGFSTQAWDDLIGNVNFDVNSFDELWASIEALNQNGNLSGRLYGDIDEITGLYKLPDEIEYITENILDEYNTAKEEAFITAQKNFNDLLGDALTGQTIGEYRPDLVTILENEEKNGTINTGLANIILGTAALAYYVMPASPDKTAAYALASTIFANAGITDVNEIYLYAISYGTYVQDLKAKANDGDDDAQKLWEKLINAYSLFNRKEFLNGQYVGISGTTETVRITAEQFAKIAMLWYNASNEGSKAKLERAAYYFAALATADEVNALKAKENNGTLSPALASS